MKKLTEEDLKGVKPYSNAWLKKVSPEWYGKGWRIHPKGGLNPPASIKPKIPIPKECEGCGQHKFHFVATGLEKGTMYWYECNTCGTLHPAR